LLALTPSRQILLLCIIVAIGASLRFAQLERPLIGWDEPGHILASTSLIHAPLIPDPHLGLRRSFVGQLLTYRHGFVTQLIPLAIYALLDLAGITLNEAALHTPVAIFGTLTILVCFLLALELTKSLPIAALSSALLAVYPLHVALSRSFNGNTIFASFFTALTLWFFVRWLKRRRSFDLYAWILALSAWIGSDNLFFLSAPLILMTGIITCHDTLITSLQRLKDAWPVLLLPLALVCTYLLVDTVTVLHYGMIDAGFLLHTLSKRQSVGPHLGLLWSSMNRAFSCVGLLMLVAAMTLELGKYLRSGRMSVPLAWCLFLLGLFSLSLENPDYIALMALPAALVTAEGMTSVSTPVAKSQSHWFVLLGASCVVLLTITYVTVSQVHLWLSDTTQVWIWGQPIADIGTKASGYILRTYFPNARVAAFYEGAELYWGRIYSHNASEADVVVIWDAETVSRLATPLRSDTVFLGRQDALLAQALASGMTTGAVLRDESDRPVCYILARTPLEIPEQRIPVLNQLFDQRYGHLESLSYPRLGFP